MEEEGVFIAQRNFMRDTVVYSNNVLEAWIAKI